MKYKFYEEKNCIIMQSNNQAKLVEIENENEDLMPHSYNRKFNMNQITQTSPLKIKPNEKLQNKCSICGYLFSFKTNLKKHIEAIHEGKKPQKCSICDYSCS